MQFSFLLRVIGAIGRNVYLFSDSGVELGKGLCVLPHPYSHYFSRGI